MEIRERIRAGEERWGLMGQWRILDEKTWEAGEEQQLIPESPLDPFPTLLCGLPELFLGTSYAFPML